MKKWSDWKKNSKEIIVLVAYKYVKNEKIAWDWLKFEKHWQKWMALKGVAVICRVFSQVLDICDEDGEPWQLKSKLFIDTSSFWKCSYGDRYCNSH